MAWGNFFKIALECPPNPKLQSTTLNLEDKYSYDIDLITLFTITG